MAGSVTSAGKKEVTLGGKNLQQNTTSRTFATDSNSVWVVFPVTESCLWRWQQNCQTIFSCRKNLYVNFRGPQTDFNAVHIQKQWEALSFFCSCRDMWWCCWVLALRCLARVPCTQYSSKSSRSIFPIIHHGLFRHDGCPVFKSIATISIVTSYTFIQILNGFIESFDAFVFRPVVKNLTIFGFCSLCSIKKLKPELMTADRSEDVSNWRPPNEKQTSL